MDVVDKCEGKSLVLRIRRNGETLELYIQPKLSKEETYKLGVWVRDDLAGIGTLTYISQDGSYGALGHAVTDMDTGSMLEVGTGKLYNSRLVGIVKENPVNRVNYQESLIMKKNIVWEILRRTANEESMEYYMKKIICWKMP